MFNEKGQALIIVLLVMIMALGIGLAVSQRIITSYKRTTNLDSGSRALAVAESAVERILILSTSTLDQYISNNSCGSNCQLTITGSDGVVAKADVTLAYTGNSISTFNVDIEKDHTYEVDLVGYQAGKQLELCWDNAVSGDNPSIYSSYIYLSSGTYKVTKYAYNSSSTTYSLNGFSSSSPDLSYPNCFTFTPASTAQFLRVRAVYNDVSLHVIPKGGATLPIQGYLITSTGYVNNVKKTIKVVKSKPTLPSSFDFAIFSTSDTQPLGN